MLAAARFPFLRDRATDPSNSMRDGAIYDVLLYSSDRGMADAVTESASEDYLFRLADSPRQLEIALQNFAPDLFLFRAGSEPELEVLIESGEARSLPATIVLGHPLLVGRQPVSQRLMALGLNRFIPLPMEPAELLSRIDNYFAAHPKPPESVQFKRLFRAGEPIFLENEIGHECFVIVSGRVRICRVIDSHTMREIGVLGPGECFGEMALLMSRPRSGTALAVDDVLVTVSTKESFIRIVETDSDFGDNLLSTLATRGRRLRETLELETPPRRKGSRAAHGEDLGGGRRRYRAGETVVKDGEPAPCFYLVEKGLLQQTSCDGSPAAPNVRTLLGPGSLVGHVAHFLDRPHGQPAAAVEETVCRSLTREEFAGAARSVPGLYLTMAQGLAVELDQLLEQVAGDQMHEVF
ncbi:MAG: cyclic nucleotide-binding domain-containing protein [Candidatus Wallbacteria bacterium]|nr:cyclic nucleotide-binding domain-containing protein [Candidatus Wallbacteria bacterium]